MFPLYLKIKGSLDPQSLYFGEEDWNLYIFFLFCSIVVHLITARLSAISLVVASPYQHSQLTKEYEEAAPGTPQKINKAKEGESR